MKTKRYTILVLAALSFAACKKDRNNTDNPAVAQGEDAKITLNIKRSAGLTTYATGDLNATDAEILVKTVDVFIFDDGAPFGIIHEHITDPALIYTDGDPTKALLPITVNGKTGSKRVYVGINLTTTAIDRIVENYANLTDGITLNFNDLVGTNSNPGTVAMFNQADFDGSPTNVINVGTGTNTITVPVSRLVAKVAVKTPAATITVPGGVLSDFQYTAGQSNTRIHIAPLRSFKDANWAAATYLASYFNLNATEVTNQPYQTVEVGPAFSDPALAGTPKLYLPENTSEEHQHREVSYISIKATFTPTEDGEPLGSGTTPADIGQIVAGTTFYAVFTSTNPGTPGIGVHYFSDSGDADAYITANPGGKKLTYTNGACYYRLYLNPNPSGTPAEGKYDVLRNVFYQATITKINTIGTTLPDQIQGEDGTPAYPSATVVAGLGLTAVVPTDVINPPSDADIESTIEITDWAVQTEDYEL